MSDKKHLIYAFLQFLEQEKKVLSPEEAESLEVAGQCLESVYGVSVADQSLNDTFPLPSSLPTIFAAGCEKLGHSKPNIQNITNEVSAHSKEAAEKHKAQGNELMKQEKYVEALECYTKAIELDDTNTVYFGNRAAAHIKLNNHMEAMHDCNKALEIDPNYSKAYGRKGLAHTGLNEHELARDAFKRALELDPDNASYRQNLDIAETKLNEQSAGGMPGGLNFGGMDFSGLLNNPALMNMATSMMANPQMQNMMAGMMSGSQGQPASPQGIGSLLQAGQHLAQQMQDSNPELVEQLRQQMRENQNPEDQ